MNLKFDEFFNYSEDLIIQKNLSFQFSFIEISKNQFILHQCLSKPNYFVFKIY